MDDLNYDNLVNSIETDYLGLTQLLNFFKFSYQYSSRRINLNLYNVNNIDANMSSVLFAMIYRLRKERNVFTYIDIPKHLNVLFRNGFFNHLANKSHLSASDFRQSTIPLKSFNIDDDIPFVTYLNNDFFGHRGLDMLPHNIKINLKSNFEEIFTNAGLHSETTDPIFTCGQYFPERNLLKFTLVDLGVGFLKKVQIKTNNKISRYIDAIDWATLGNTTKDPSLGPGGLGLKEIRKYCSDNNGSLHIVSGDAYWSITSNKVFTHTLSYMFRGSIVNLIFRKI
jgi:hypothetical protein